MIFFRPNWKEEQQTFAGGHAGLLALADDEGEAVGRVNLQQVRELVERQQIQPVLDKIKG